MTIEDGHAHDGGLAQDLAMIRALNQQEVGRRRTLGLLFSAGGAALIGACGGSGSASTSSTSSSSSTTTSTSSSTSSSSSSSSSSSTSSSSGTCIADPEETNGPYPADGSNSSNGSVVNVLDDTGIARTDIRSSFGSSTGTADGVTTKLTITLVNVNGSCAPLEGYAIYIWHCTREGTYSLYTVPGENYLRGVGVTDANGQVTFTSIFPGCYSGRYPHIHFEIYPSLARATGYANRVLTSQFAMPADACNTVYATSAYSSSKSNFAAISTSSDNVFGDNTSAQIAAMTPSMTGDITNGYTGTVTVGLAI
ncbi:intradiol ring-cleavage dioxygenase [Sphingobium sp. Sx8-8]|uniref:dioxygenase family protein n=1 Tax=Sphingobium sp. Sx8-8 TaxID=2933617 RepID=UPI001F595BB8|nr:intradiol ring-cleavage dioxygenase [Sphingobium sp. Sx8-8]